MGLALTALDGNSGGCDPARGIALGDLDDAVGHVDRTCRTAVRGRRAARALAEWAKRFGLTEAELQLLWRLRSAPQGGFDQTALAAALAFSPAQISASVERLRSQAWICASGAVGDRRRHNWQLSTTGRELLDTMLNAATLLRYEPNDEAEPNSNGSRRREAAA
jgi:DNA-binding MarR family transcriptional regulator